MTIEVSILNPSHQLEVAFRSSSLSVDLIAAHPAPKVSGQSLPRARISAALLAFSLVAGAIIHPTASLDVQLLTPVVIGANELEGIYNYTDLLGRYIITADGLVFEVKEENP